MAKKNVLIHVFFGIISFGIYYYHLRGPDLVWNMFLALLALDFSLLSYCIKQKVVRWSSGLLWLFFYPNTFYMLTDIVHMNFTDSVLWNKVLRGGSLGSKLTLLLRLTYYPVNLLAAPRALTGMGSIFLVNQWMDYRNIPVSVGLNVLSFFVSGCLGIPGVAMLYGIMFYQFM